ncbi:N-acetyltransferase [Vibrio rotiferianus]|uniref:N-acetyltransferase n=1 Tax=Vibrio rotiferianus TaxID=190895 RepID=A0A7Y3ZDQ6_9VIBR|nr:N-acetyltransferase [Vibrio rotiferianus]NOH51156.1 N-acetyltransferase [Vibrio rotiferianus]
MNFKITVQDEVDQDIEGISLLTQTAFKEVEISRNTEHFIISHMRRTGALKVSLVAKTNDQLLGHIAFSPIQIDGQDSDWFALGPISVLPELQRTGIGSMLVKAGLNRLKQMKAGGCVLVGSPDYYKRFGFLHDTRLEYPDVPREFFLTYPIGVNHPSGVVTLNEGYWATN